MISFYATCHHSSGIPSHLKNDGILHIHIMKYTINMAVKNVLYSKKTKVSTAAPTENSAKMIIENITNTKFFIIIDNFLPYSII